MFQRLLSSHLYGILDADYVPQKNMELMAQKLLQGGVDVLQLRAKHATEAEIIAMAEAIIPWARAAEVPLIINDYPHLVPMVGAHGAHIGQDDMTVAEARSLAGRDATIGLSTHSLEQVKNACLQKPDYIGFGPIFATPTKPDYIPIGLTDIASAQTMVSFPVFCIGGITLETLPQVIEAGAKRVVVVSALLQAEDPEQTVKHINKTFFSPKLLNS